MTSFRFLNSDGSVNVEFTTDLIGYDKGSENLTVCQVENLSANQNDAVTQGLINTFTREKHSVSELKKYATDNALTLVVVEQGNEGSKSNANSILLAAPTTFAAVVDSATQITATWTKTPKATGYILDRATNAGFTTGLVSTVLGDVATKVITGLTTATHYYFRIKATAVFATASTYATADAVTS